MRRTLPPRPTYEEQQFTAEGRVVVPSGASRPQRLVEREAPYLIDELKRIALVSGTCIGLLIFLTVVDRMR